MTNEERPHTAEQIAALPEGGGFGMEITVVDGKTIQRPVAPDLIAFYSDEADSMGYMDSDGVWWALGRYADGRWFRHQKY